MFSLEPHKATNPLPPELEILPFERVPEEYHIDVFGVPYVRSPDGEGGFLYVTRWGWHRLPHLRPANWFSGRRFVLEGRRLRGSTGTVYQYPSRPPNASPMELLIKVSRLAEVVPGKLGADTADTRMLSDAAFNSPFEEFALVEDLRSSRFGPATLHVRTKRPLAIYCSPRDLPGWQLGRQDSEFQFRWSQLDHDQEHAPEGMRIHLLPQRQYFVLFAWVPGIDAQQAWEEGLITQTELEQLSERVNHELALKGFRILDNKPKHFILRKDLQGNLLRHHGELVYVQVDFELLLRTSAYEEFLSQHPSPPHL